MGVEPSKARFFALHRCERKLSWIRDEILQQ